MEWQQLQLAQLKITSQGRDANVSYIHQPKTPAIDHVQ